MDLNPNMEDTINNIPAAPWNVRGDVARAFGLPQLNPLEVPEKMDRKTIKNIIESASMDAMKDRVHSGSGFGRNHELTKKSLVGYVEFENQDAAIVAMGINALIKNGAKFFAERVDDDGKKSLAGFKIPRTKK